MSIIEKALIGITLRMSITKAFEEIKSMSDEKYLMPELMKRRAIYKIELIEICERQQLPTHGLRIDLINRLREQGSCECIDECGRRLSGDVHFDHRIPNAQLYEGDEIDWRALLPVCHAIKTKLDNARTAKAKRQGGETGQQARRRRNGPKLKGGRGFQKPPPNHDPWGKRRGKWASRPMKSRNTFKKGAQNEQ